MKRVAYLTAIQMLSLQIKQLVKLVCEFTFLPPPSGALMEGFLTSLVDKKHANGFCKEYISYNGSELGK